MYGWHPPWRLGHGEEILNCEVYILKTGTICKTVHQNKKSYCTVNFYILTFMSCKICLLNLHVRS